MKLTYGALTVILFLAPFSTHAAWYWLLNPSNPEQGDFVQMSALEYAETNVSKNLLVYVEDDFKDLLKKSEKYKQCDSEYDDFIYSLQRLSTTTLVTEYKEDNFNDCIREGEIQEAIDDCDLEYIEEEFSDGQKVIYNKQIASCREEIEEKTKVNIVTVPAQTQSQPPIPHQVIPSVTQTIPAPLETVPVAIGEGRNVTTEDQKVGGTSFENTNQGNQEEKMAPLPLEQETGSVNPPNFFQKVIGFLSRLFSW